MTMETSPVLLSSRAEWLETVAARCQVFAGAMMIPDGTRSIPEHASAFIGGIPDPPLPVDDLALRQLLLDVAAGWGASLHERAHVGSSRRRCGFDVTRTLRPLVGASPRGAKHRFLEWACGFSVELSRSHPVSAAGRAAAIIRERRGKRIDAAALADRIGVSPQQLRREFRRTFGVTIARHERHVRLLRALDVLREQPVKIEPVALEAGYASKKSFYDAFKRTVGMTPTAFARLPSDCASRDRSSQEGPADRNDGQSLTSISASHR